MNIFKEAFAYRRHGSVCHQLPPKPHRHDDIINMGLICSYHGLGVATGGRHNRLRTPLMRTTILYKSDIDPYLLARSRLKGFIQDCREMMKC